MTEANRFLYLSDETLAGLGITTTDVIDCIETTLRAQAEGKVWAAPKVSVLPGDGRYVMATLAVSDTPRITVVKSVMVSPGNPARGLPGINGAIMLLDSETGLLLAVMDANWITAVRTAGLSAVIAKRLANPQSSSIAFIGCGVEARSHLDAFTDIFPLTEVRAFGRGSANVEKLCGAAREKGLNAIASASAQETLEGADLVVTSITLSYDLAPFLDARWLKPGAFAVMTDLALPWIPESMAAFDTIIIDDRAQEAAMEKPMVDRALVSGDMTELVTGRVSVSYSGEQRTAFVFRGMAIGDFALASLAYTKSASGM